mmetsp:Transcript_123797/g.396270  ORF Transcript_123797/g.396270 Transcript_123797/m.396270 type:complete len:83 (+) Transcript_123797:2-250(+)
MTTLRREDFMRLVDHHEERCPDLKKRVRSFCCWLALQRAVLLEAKLRQSGGSFLPMKNSGSCPRSMCKPLTGPWNPDEWQQH